MAETEAPAKMPLGESDTVVAIREHLADAHRFIYNVSKLNKAQLLAHHQAQHDQGLMKDGKLHVHKEMTEEEQARYYLEVGKPLNTTQRNALSQVVNNDFASLASEMRQMALDVKTSRTESIQEQFRERRDAAEKVAVEMRAKLGDLKRQLRMLATDNPDVTVNLYELERWMGSDTKLIGVTVSDQNAAVNAMKDSVDRDLNRALNALERQRLAAQRVVLLAAVDPDAQKLLDQIPTAKQMMVEAGAKALETSSSV